jgi:hypothetical protein
MARERLMRGFSNYDPAEVFFHLAWPESKTNDAKIIHVLLLKITEVDWHVA